MAFDFSIVLVSDIVLNQQLLVDTLDVLYKNKNIPNFLIFLEHVNIEANSKFGIILILSGSLKSL